LVANRPVGGIEFRLAGGLDRAVAVEAREEIKRIIIWQENTRKKRRGLENFGQILAFSRIMCENELQASSFTSQER